MRLIRKLRRFLINVFGFSKTETNGFLVLIVLVFLAAIVPRVYFRFHKPDFGSDESLGDWVAQMEKSISLKRESEEKKEVVTIRSRTNFDPNSASLKTLTEVGIPDILAKRIINYRNKGGKFRRIDDLKRIYGFSDELYAMVKPQIHIESIEEELENDMSGAVYATVDIAEDISFDLNTATIEELKKIRGIGDILSKRIIKYRDLLGGYQDIIQLNEVYGLKPEVIQEISKYATISDHFNKLSLNEIDSIKHLASHPYIDYNLARAIINYRTVHGNFQSIDELQNIKVLDDSLYHKIAPYLSL